MAGPHGTDGRGAHGGYCPDTLRPRAAGVETGGQRDKVPVSASTRGPLANGSGVGVRGEG